MLNPSPTQPKPTTLGISFTMFPSLVFFTDNYHDECDVDTDCNEPDTICEPGSKICVCTPGYSFNPSTKSCVTSKFH